MASPRDRGFQMAPHLLEDGAELSRNIRAQGRTHERKQFRWSGPATAGHHSFLTEPISSTVSFGGAWNFHHEIGDIFSGHTLLETVIHFSQNTVHTHWSV